jgi:hypothetical protein
MPTQERLLRQTEDFERDYPESLPEAGPPRPGGHPLPGRRAGRDRHRAAG